MIKNALDMQSSVRTLTETLSISQSNSKVQSIINHSTLCSRESKIGIYLFHILRTAKQSKNVLQVKNKKSVERKDPFYKTLFCFICFDIKRQCKKLSTASFYRSHFTSHFTSIVNTCKENLAKKEHSKNRYVTNSQ